MSLKRFLQFKNWKTQEVAPNPIDVTGRSQREINQITRGMQINIGDDWFVEDTRPPVADERDQEDYA